MLERKEINLEDILLIIENMDPFNQRIYINLYKNYNLFSNISDIINTTDSKKIKEKLSTIEDNIYTVNGKKLSQKERINLELKNIKRNLNKKINLEDDLSTKAFNQLETNARYELKELSKLLKEVGTTNPQMVNYFKKRISVLQASLGISIKFFNASIETFEEKINILLEKNNQQPKMKR